MATKKWKPKKDGKYYRIYIFYDDIKIIEEKNDNMQVDRCLFRMGNCYKTKIEANKKLKLIRAILKQP